MSGKQLQIKKKSKENCLTEYIVCIIQKILEYQPTLLLVALDTFTPNVRSALRSPVV